MTNTVIVTSHPYDGSFCHALMASAKAGAEKAGNTVDVIDLEADGFDPVMYSKDLIGFLKHKAQDPQAIDYIERVKAADHLILIFPIWWELMPAMMKGFIDKVVFPGETFNYTKGGVGMASNLPNLKSTTIMTTMNTPKSLYRWVFGNAIQRALSRHLRQNGTQAREVDELQHGEKEFRCEAPRLAQAGQRHRCTAVITAFIARQIKF